MEQQGIKKLKLPEWYVFEKETENTISKLSSLRDLSFYLRHQDSAIRRMAILRINELKLKDSVDILTDLMDDPSESSINKELAAWTVKAVSIKWDVDLYVSSKLLSRYSGNEPLSKLFCVNLKDNEQQPDFSFPSFMENYDLELDESDMRVSDEIFLDMAFSFKEWLSGWSKSFPGLFKMYLTHICDKILSTVQKASKRTIKTEGSIRKKVLTENYIRYTIKHKIKYSMLRLWQLAGNLLFNFAYFFFTPVRLIIRHRKAAITLLLTVYLLGAYTEPGKYITYKYLRTDLIETQTQVYYTSREILTYAWAEFKEIVGLPERSYNTVYGTGGGIAE